MNSNNINIPTNKLIRKCVRLHWYDKINNQKKWGSHYNNAHHPEYGLITRTVDSANRDGERIG